MSGSVLSTLLILVKWDCGFMERKVEIVEWEHPESVHEEEK